MMLYRGDCLQEMKKIESGSVDLVLTDPPYGTTACKWDSVIPFEPMWEQLNRIIKPNGAIVLFGSEPFSSALRMSNIKDYKYDAIWIKNRPSNVMLSKKQLLKYHENISFFYSKQCTYNPQMTVSEKDNRIRKGIIYDVKSGVTDKNKGYVSDTHNPKLKYPKTLLNYKRDWRPQDQLHSTQKPLELLKYLVKTYTNEGETVLDFTMGSGSTGVAAANTNREFIGIEQDEKYFDIATKRIHEAKQELTLFK